MAPETVWRPPERRAGLGGLILDWLSWQPTGEAPAPDEAIALLARDGSPTVWAGAQPQRHAGRDAIGVYCRDWPRGRGRYVYALARLRAAQPLRCRLRLGSYTGYRAWLDGACLATAAPGPTFELDDNCCLPDLAAGEHSLLIELDRSLWETTFHVRVCQPDGSELAAEALHVAACASETMVASGVRSAFEFYNEQFDRPGAWSLEVAPAAGAAAPEHGQGEDDWRGWHDGFRRQYAALLDLPPATLTGVELLERGPWQGLRRERLRLHGGVAGPLPVDVLAPEGDGAPRAALLCIHGHGAGKADVVGVSTGDPAQAERIAAANYTYALEFARRGYITLAPDLQGFGERCDAERPRAGRDPCDNSYFKAALLGLTPLALNLVDLRLVVEYALQRSDIAADRLGCVGLSLGGRMTMYLAALDPRIRVAVASGALNTLRERLTSFAGCGSQLLPGLLRYGDTPELFGLIAPRPLLLELGTQDGTSPELYAAAAYRLIQRAYSLAGVEERLAIDIFARGHRFSGRKAFPFLARWLPPQAP